METSTGSARPFQFFVKLVDGKTSVLNFTNPHVDALSIKRRIFEISRIPVPSQRLILAGRQLDDRSVVSWPGSTLHLSLRLPGGKGGFGSLLRGAATKAGQKKTNNFDACRDMSGRRLRHVNAEKKLEEWRAEEEERKLERMAEEFIKKAAKKGKKGAGEVAAADKYVQKYREQSAKCVAQVEECVRDAIASCGMSKRSVKRKAGVGSGTNAKKLKIWMGKRKVGESDNDDSGDDTCEDDEDEKSTISDGAMQLNLIKEVDGSSDSVTGGRQDGEAYTSSSNGSGSEEEKETGMQAHSESSGCSGGGVVPEEKSALVNPVSSEGCPVMSLESAVVAETEAAELGNESRHKVESENCIVLVSQSLSAPDSGNEVTTEAVQGLPEAGGFSEDKVAVVEEAASVEANVPEDAALDFDLFNSAAEMEVLGMERLKLELQTRGLKCGGTLQERASRLFLLKTTPLDKIPKKHLAKK